MADLSKIIALKDDAAKYMVKEITHICKNLLKRDPGSEGEKQSIEYMAKQLKEECGCDDVHIDSFEVHPKSFFGWVYFTITFVLLAIAAFFFMPVLSMIFVFLGLFIVTISFGLYTKAMDWAFPKKTGHNVYGTKKPTGEVKRRIFFNGHPDAVWEWPVNYHFGGVAFEAHSVICILGAVYYFVIALLYVIKHGVHFGLPESFSDPLVIAAFVGFIFIPFLIGLYFIANYKRVVDGANDNLSGCYIGIALLKFLEDNNIEFEHTEIGVLNTGCEEAGTRGAMAFADQHMGDFDDVPTFVYSFDTIYDPSQLMVNYRDLNGLKKSDKEASDLFLNSARELDIPCKKGWVPPFGGCTDTVPLNRCMRAAGITGLNHKLENYYHTRRDTYDNMNLEGLANCFAITAKTLEHFDEGALD
ncbi:MAG: M28 family peptidase [Clostridia bacterium]|nr:M28 family peptidase [Clostridia bacterium]